MFELTRHRPKILDAYIDCFSIYEFSDDAPVKLDPNGKFELIFQLEHSFSHNTLKTNGWEERPFQFVGGPHTQSYWIKPNQKKSNLLSVEFKSAGAKFFIPDNLNAYKNRSIDLRDAFDKYISLESIVKEKVTINQNTLEKVELYLQKLFAPQKQSVVDLAMQLIDSSKGTIPIQKIARQINLSVAQFRKRFNEEVGMSPKEYSKILRFNLALQAMHNHPGKKLSELTYELGYFDQAHFIRDFQSITGNTPKQHLKTLV